MSREKPHIAPLHVHRARYADRVERALKKHANGKKRPAKVRALPPPFEGWCTLSNDVDGFSFEGAGNVQKILREGYALPVSDSVFPHALFNAGLVAGENVAGGHSDFGPGDIFDFETFMLTAGPWLRGAYRGRVDTVHGWLLRQQIRIGDDVVELNPLSGADASKWRGSVFGRAVNATIPRKIRLNFRSPAGWHTRVPPRYLIFDYLAPTVRGEIKLVFLDGADAVGEVDITEMRNASPASLMPVVIDMQPVVGKEPDLLRRLDVEVRIYGIPERVEIRRPMMVSWLREEISEQLSLMDAFNLNLCAFTSHGGGYDIGKYKTTELEAADPRGMADRIENPFYALDRFHAFGIRFLNSASNTSKPSPVEIAELIFPKVLNGGQLTYDFDRFLDSSVDGQNPSLENLAGWQVERLIDLIDQAGSPASGGAIYTHLLAKSTDDPLKGSRDIENILSPSTHDALLQLSQRYYGIGDTAERRIFVAPQALLLRYCQILQGLENASSYDPQTNTVFVDSWCDGVTAERVPVDVGGACALRYCSFLVDDANSARLVVDGDEHAALFRHAGGGDPDTVTVIDDSHVTPVVGAMRLVERGDIEMVLEGGKLTDGTDAPNVIGIDDDRATIRFFPSHLTLADQSALRVVLSGALVDVSWSVEIITDDGMHIGMFVGDMDAVGLFRACPGPDELRHDSTVPFYMMTPLAGHSALPTGRVKEVTLRIDHAQDRRIEIAALHLLRDDPRVRKSRCIVGGRVADGLSIEEVRMDTGDGIIETDVLDGGWYVFLDALEPGSIVSLWGLCDGERYLPDQGARFEVYGDTLEIDFSKPIVRGVS